MDIGDHHEVVNGMKGLQIQMTYTTYQSPKVITKDGRLLYMTRILYHIHLVVRIQTIMVNKSVSMVTSNII